jgi:hypothetical protein
MAKISTGRPQLRSILTPMDPLPMPRESILGAFLQPGSVVDVQSNQLSH